VYEQGMKKIGKILFLTQGFLFKANCRHFCVPPSSFRNFSSVNQCPKMELKKTLKDWKFHDPKLASLPLDPETENFIRNHIKSFSICFD